MTITQKECAKHREEISREAREEKHKSFNKLQAYMETSLDKVNETLKKINDNLIKNDLNTSNLLIAQEKNDLQIDTLKKWKWMTTGALIIISIMVLPSTIYIVKDYLNSKNNIVTKQEVQQMIITELNKYLIIKNDQTQKRN